MTRACILALVCAGALAGRVGAVETLTGLDAVRAGEWAEATLLSADSVWSTARIDLKGRQRADEWIITGPLVPAADGGYVILGVPFRADPATAVKDTSGANVPLSAVQAGGVVEARIGLAAGGYVARKMRVHPPGTRPEVEGAIEAVGVDAIRILGRDIHVSENPRVRRLEKRVQPLRLTDDDKLLPGSQHAVGPFAVASALVVDTRDMSNYDLNSTDPRDRADTEPTLRTEIAGSLSPRVRLFTKVSAIRRFILEDQRGTRAGFSRVQLNEAYVLLLGVGSPNLALQIGRQDFDEPHEWLYDEELDGARLHWIGSAVSAEASLSTRADSLTNDERNTWNSMVVVTATPLRPLALGAYAIHRAPRAADTQTSLTWYGARIVSIKAGGFRGWGDLAIVRGRDAGLVVRGHAHHVSGTWQILRRGRIALNAAWARGSGDVTLSDGVDNAFRQTGFHDDNDRFGGVTGFRYYGELTRPSLTNLSVVTLGLGARPVTGSSVDLLVHMYHQPVASPLFTDSALDTRPSGLSPSLGHEVDLVVGIRSIRRLKLEYVLARFWAGPAFPGAEHATSSRLQIDLGL